MNIGSRGRWTVYAIAASMTAAAMAWVDRKGDTAAVVEAVRPSAPEHSASASAPALAMTSPSTSLGSLDETALARIVPPRARTLATPAGDPFDVQDEQPAPATLADARSAAAAAAALAPAPPQAPPVPFRYLGKWIEGGRTTVLLMREGKSIAVTATGRLDDQYAVQAIEENRVVLKYLPLGTTQNVAFDAAPADNAAAVAAAPAAAPDDDPEQPSN